MPEYSNEDYGIKFSYPEYMRLDFSQSGNVIRLLSRQSSDDPFREIITIEAYNSSGNLISEMNSYLNWINKKPNVEQFDSTIMDDFTNNKLGVGKEATISFTDKSLDNLSLKGRAYIAKKGNSFIFISFYAHAEALSSYLSAYNLVKGSIDFL